MPSFEAILHIASILSVVGTGGMVLYRLGRFFERVELTFKTLADNAERHAAEDAARATRHEAEIADVRGKIDKISEAMTTLAVQKEQIAGLRAEIASLRDDISGLRHARAG